MVRKWRFGPLLPETRQDKDGAGRRVRIANTTEKAVNLFQGGTENTQTFTESD